MDNWIYSNNSNNSSRYILGQIGIRNLVCIGINPSTATPTNLDRTLLKVRKIAKNKCYDGWVMLNVYPQRATDPNNIHQVKDTIIHYQNLEEISHFINEISNADICAVWGELIDKRPFLKECLSDLVQIIGSSKQWFHLSDLTKKGHPRHPLYLSNDSNLNIFDISSYLINL